MDGVGPEPVALGADGLPVTPVGVHGFTSPFFSNSGDANDTPENETSLLLSPEFKDGEYRDTD